ncbi:MAG: sigma-54 dependent transcriptional regulator [Verrucomicrobiota bacterium]
MKHILVVDDEDATIESFKAIFYDQYMVHSATSVAEANTILGERRVDLLILDLIMPEVDGMEFLQQVRVSYPDLPVIMVSAETSTETTAEAIRLGALEFITKPFDINDVRTIAERALASAVMQRQMEANRRENLRQGEPQWLLGESAVIRRLQDNIKRIARSDEHCLILGERGSGKQAAAQLLHDESARSGQPFISLQCISLPDSLAEEELFGRDPLSVGNGSDRQMEMLGRLDLAFGGSLHLGDVQSLPIMVQRKLLDVAKGNSFARVESLTPVMTDVRFLVSAPDDAFEDDGKSKYNCPLHENFSGNVLEVPPLRERREDIPLLAYSFLNRFRTLSSSSVAGIDSEAIELLQDYNWPGNVKELSNVIESAVYSYGDEKSVTPEHLPREIQSREMPATVGSVGTRTLEEQVDSFQRGIIIDALRKANGVKNRAARILGTTPRILNYRISQLKIETTAK